VLNFVVGTENVVLLIEIKGNTSILLKEEMSIHEYFKKLMKRISKPTTSQELMIPTTIEQRETRN